MAQTSLGKNSISACIVSYNDAHQIERCLKSLKGVVDEIIVTHDGPCTDDSLKIARKYTERVYEGKRMGFAEPHRADQYKMARGEWVLIIDSDEFLSDKLHDNLRKLVESGEADCYLFLWKLWDGKKYFTKKYPHRIGVVRKSKFRYLGLHHADFLVDGKTKNVDLHLEHHPSYNNFTWECFRTKWIRRLKTHAKQIIEPIENLPQFQYNSKKYNKHTEWIKRYSILSAPWIFIYFFLATLILAPAVDRKAVLKFAFLQAFYYFLLAIEVFRLRVVNIFSIPKLKH